LSGETSSFIAALEAIVGARGILTGAKATRGYRTGFRGGTGEALAVVRPRSLVEQWRVLNACVAANKIVIMQAANTGLTGGSTPADGYDRQAVIVNTMLIDKILTIDEGRQVICLPGATLHQLERVLEPFEREPHSVIGSSCIGASVIGGICNNSGGALIQRGPAYTQLALFAQLDASGELTLLNHLGIKLGDRPEEILHRLENGAFEPEDIEHPPHCRASDGDYARRIREIDSTAPARFNADPSRLFEASGSAGRIALFAVRLDTFPRNKRSRVFYIGTRDPGELTALRRHILAHFEHLPVAGEYVDRTMFDIAAQYGKDTFMLIELLGTARLPAVFRIKRAYDAFAARLRCSWASSDRLLQGSSRLLPNHLPVRVSAFRNRFEHHLMLKMAGPGIEEARDYLSSVLPSRTGDFFECTEIEARKAFLHRFVAAGAAIRYAAIHADEVEDVIALDVALRRNDVAWSEQLPDDMRNQLRLALYYGHFFCHVFHQDYIVRKGCDAAALKARMLTLLDRRGAKYPAEHNLGHLYRADARLIEFYRTLDPCNAFNPGIGQSSKLAHWGGLESDTLQS
jgi:D-lactate dehydrogenase (quinone)